MRLKYIDILKGISILCIMLLHFEDGVFPNYLNIWIGSFMVNAFLFCSGWLLVGKVDQHDRDVIKHSFYSLAIPYISFSVLILLFDVLLVLCKEMSYMILLRDIYKTFVLRGIGTLWFLPALFGGLCIFLCFKKNSLPNRIGIVCVTLWILLFYINIWPLFHFNETLKAILGAPLMTVVKVCHAWFLVAAGYYVSKYYKEKAIASPLTERFFYCILLFGTVSLFFAFTVHINVVEQLISGIALSTGMLIFSSMVQSLDVTSFFSFWGRNSLIVMCTHYSIVQELCVIVNRHLYGQDHLCGFSAFVYFFIALCVEYGTVLFFNKYLSFMLGKKRKQSTCFSLKRQEN